MVMSSNITRRALWRRPKEWSLPVLTKEMRSRMRGMRTQWLLFLCTGVFSTVAIFMLMWFGNEFSQYNSPQDTSQIGKTLFSVLAYVEGGLLALIVPSFTAGAISLEREQQTLETLLLTPLSTRNIIMGKLLSALGLITLLLVCTLPVIAVTFMLGGVAPSQVGWVLALILSTAALFGAIGLYCSARFQKTATAIVMTYSICLVWLAGVPFLCYLISESGGYYSNSNELSDLAFLLLLTLVIPAGLALVGIKFQKMVTRKPGSWVFKTILWSLCAVTGIMLVTISPAADNWVYNASTVVLSLLISAQLSCLITVCYGQLKRRPTSLRANLVLWLTLAVSGIVISYACPDVIRSMMNDGPFILLGNSGIAMVLLFIPPNVSSWLVALFIPLTVILLLLGAWMMLVLSERQLERQRGCRTQKSLAQLVRSDE